MSIRNWPLGKFSLPFPNKAEKKEIDLSIARTDELIATKPISVQILSYTSGATFSLKFEFKDGSTLTLTQDELSPGDIIALMAEKLYLTNSAQSGHTLKLLIMYLI